MGKAANLKRAKKLKEAKRQREQAALYAQGHPPPPGSLELQKRNEAKGFKTIPNETGTKYSEVLQEFAKPILEYGDTIETLTAKFNLAVLAWNAALKKEEDEVEYRQFRNKMLTITPGFALFEDIFEELVQRKAEEFAGYKHVISDFEIKKARDQYHLTVAVFL